MNVIPRFPRDCASLFRKISGSPQA